MNIADLRVEVLSRDRECIIALVVDKSHVCRDRWGQEHRADDLEKLTLGHVKEHAGGKRRDDPGWCVAQCHESNDRHMESADAAIVRAYLEGIRRALARYPPDLLEASARTGIPVGRLAIMELEEAMR